MLSDNQFSKIQNDLTLYIGEEHLVVSAKAAFHPVKHLQIAIEKTAAENRLDDLSASLAKIDIALLKQHFALSNEAKILIVMSHQWLASCLLPWSKMMLKAKTAYEFAKQQLQNAGYTLHEDDTICIDDAPFGQARMALAYPAQLQTSLLQLLNRCHLKIIAQLPLSALLKEQLLSNATKNQAASAYVLLEPNFLSLAIYQKNQLQQWQQQLRETNKTSFENARTFWQRICLQHPEYQALQKIKVFDSAELEPSDTKNLSTFLSPFLPPFEAQNIQLTALANHPLDGATNQRSATNPHKIILFLLAITLIFLSTTYFLQQKKITKTQQQLTQITQKKTASAALVKEKIIPKISKKQIQAVNAAIDALNFPLLTVFKTIEPPKNISVALLSIDLNHQTEQSSTRIKINGEAPDYAAMIQYVSFLSQQDDIQKSILLRHETVQDTKNNRGPNNMVDTPALRFTIEAIWKN